mmetsp:Transcript_19939/g.46735  ORF Transcript_19939/g.46735 Transcript_19939/m.46735 type:complete len:229 (+) Transcript_19939:1284-1970(+)
MQNGIFGRDILALVDALAVTTTPYIPVICSFMREIHKVFELSFHVSGAESRGSVQNDPLCKVIRVCHKKNDILVKVLLIDGKMIIRCGQQDGSLLYNGHLVGPLLRLLLRDCICSCPSSLPLLLLHQPCTEFLPILRICNFSICRICIIFWGSFLRKPDDAVAVASFTSKASGSHRQSCPGPPCLKGGHSRRCCKQGQGRAGRAEGARACSLRNPMPLLSRPWHGGSV